MQLRRGLISYDGLPISSGGAHGLGRMRPEAAWGALQRFLSQCTTASLPKRVSPAVSWLASRPLPTTWLGEPGHVTVDYEFHLRSMSSAEELPFQDSAHYLGQAYNGYGVLLGQSGCRLTLASPCALSIVLFLPFEEPSPELWAYVAFLQSHLPMKFSKKHWKHWTLTKKSTAYLSHKIQHPQE